MEDPMKKIVALLLSALLLIALPITAFADWNRDFSEVPEEDVTAGTPINRNDFTSSTNKIRGEWTPSRFASDDNGVYNPDVKYVKDGDATVMQVVGNQYFKGDGDIGLGQYTGITMKLNTADGFAGLVLNYPNSDSLEAVETTATQDDRYFTVYPAVNGGEGVDYLFYSGIGYSVVKGSKGVIRVYVRTKTADDKNDVIYYDFDSKLDLTADYHNYKLYRAADGGEVRFYLDETLGAIVKLGDGTAEILDAAGTSKAKSEKAVFEQTGNFTLASYGANSKFLVKACECTSFETYPGEAAATTEAQTTAAPVTTKAAEQTTAEPKTTTAEPEATTANPETTTAAPSTEKTEEKSGCGSVAAIGVAVIVSVLGAAVITKKKN